MSWVSGEKGPQCFCGMPTSVMLYDDGSAGLLCIFHRYEAGAIFPLPTNGKPDNWPNLTNDEIKSLVEAGMAEQNNED